MKSTLVRRAGLPALFLSGAIVGSALTGATFARGAGQPHMASALRSLQTARTQLQTAIPDKGGHRDRAIGFVNSAITETQAGIDYGAMH